MGEDKSGSSFGRDGVKNGVPLVTWRSRRGLYICRFPGNGEGGQHDGYPAEDGVGRHRHRVRIRVRRAHLEVI